MKFIINSNVSFNEQDGTLHSVNDPGNSIPLLKPTGRLLSLFVRNNNLLITREQLLNDVWEDYGLKASNNNLNNYISGLRKSLSQLGEEELLITYPRQGFKFMAKNIHREEITASSDISNESATFDNNHLQGEGKRSALIRGGPWKILALCTLFCLALLTVGLFYKSYAQNNINSLGQYKNCKIYSIKNNRVTAEEIKSMVYQARYNCDVRANIYYYGDMEDKDLNTNAPLLAYCPLDALKPCENTYIKK
ncbi:winged helix-turn-helix domain-containing protein [Serratia sp. root2]|uniref:transcriptional regulator n=1 Tax=Serratia sp. root2 TaxID=3059676 RepID=UPI00288E57E4|nr:winged helix-turn-helix domain-containing protein [Serratia sp. root2]MDT3252444.1 winged helix-turn-helix domain-containing protein [Serratia sp. root2]